MKSIECWRLIWRLPYRHPIKLQFDAASHGPCMPIHFRIQLKQRCLKWAYKRLHHDTGFVGRKAGYERAFYWMSFRIKCQLHGFCGSSNLVQRLRSLPRDNKPLPLP
jgi:hypothetical protein